MRPARPWLFPLMTIAVVGCQTLHEEMPGSASGTPSITLQPGNITVTPIASPSAPATSPTPAPAATPTPAPAATPTPAPTPQPTPTPQVDATPNPAIYKVRVGFFGISCRNGHSVPRNGEGLLPVGCTGFVTATPKDRNNVDVPAHVHGSRIDWIYPGGNQVEVRESVFDSDFNRDVIGKHPGGFSLCATVGGVTGCLDGNVIP